MLALGNKHNYQDMVGNHQKEPSQISLAEQRKEKQGNPTETRGSALVVPITLTYGAGQKHRVLS